MLITLRGILILLGASAVAIAGSILLLGAETTAATAEGLLAALGGPPAVAEPWPATMDSELRFYAALWGAYGIAALLAALRIRARRGWIPWLALTFFAGGVGRAISIAQIGAPHPVFVLLMAIELVLPAIILALWRATRDPLEA